MNILTFRAKALILFTVFYVLIEAQAMLFLMDIFRSPISAQQMADYERFGYATFGLGVVLLCLRGATSSLPTKRGIIVVLLALPFVYVASVWSVYEAVARSHLLIPDAKRPLAMRHSMNILNHDGERSALARAWQFYTSPELSTSPAEDATRFTQRLPMSDTAIRAIYIRGIQHAADFSYTYKTARGRLNYNKWHTLAQRAQNAAKHQIDEHQLAEALQITQSTLFTRWLLPNQVTTFAANSTFTDNDSGALHFHAIAMLLRDGRPSDRMTLIESAIRPYHQQRQTADKLVAKRLGEALGVTLSPQPHTRWPELMRQGYSDRILSPFTRGERVPAMPWSDRDASPWDDAAYLFAVQHIAPFLFNGVQPLVSLNNIRNDDVRFTYLNNLRQGLHPELKKNWHAYRQRSLESLASSPDAWGNFATREMNQDYLRISTVLPWLLTLSFVMIGINLLMLVKQSKIAGGVATVAVVALVTIQPAAVADWVLSLLLPISVNAPAIFVL
jgi:hypothetical protein